MQKKKLTKEEIERIFQAKPRKSAGKRVYRCTRCGSDAVSKDHGKHCTKRLKRAIKRREATPAWVPDKYCR